MPGRWNVSITDRQTEQNGITKPKREERFEKMEWSIFLQRVE